MTGYYYCGQEQKSILDVSNFGHLNMLFTATVLDNFPEQADHGHVNDFIEATVRKVLHHSGLKNIVGDVIDEHEQWFGQHRTNSVENSLKRMRLLYSSFNLLKLRFLFAFTRVYLIIFSLPVQVSNLISCTQNMVVVNFFYLNLIAAKYAFAGLEIRLAHN